MKMTDQYSSWSVFGFHDPSCYCEQRVKRACFCDQKGGTVEDILGPVFLTASEASRVMKVGAVKKSAVSSKWVSMLCLSLSVTCLYVEYSSSEKTGLTREREREGVCEEGEGERGRVCVRVVGGGQQT